MLCNVYYNDKAIVNAYNEIEGGNTHHLHFIEDFHITSLYIGKNHRKRETGYFKNFKPGYKMDLEIEGFIFVPGKIVVGICYPDQSAIKIENRFPHMTLMKGKWPAKTSNDVCDYLFGKGGELAKEYQSNGFARMNDFAYKCSVKGHDGWNTAYVARVKPHLKLSAEARASNSSF